ncbi:hypothetical protein [Halosolutus gelatinilyticus]|uniref:hypothetical protein n=1 Tax=Halosolutus gelatinilyticus TaxID=2931975 RepID=UPI001FF177BF|nr:hypothetical protein [Halosolutus gelatinilyticus]
MVMPDRNDDRTDGHDRGQLILIGAITLAFIILGVVVVFNGVLYTETLSSTATNQGASDDTTIEAEIEGGIGGIARYGNLAWEADDRSGYENELEDVIEDDGGFAEQYLNATANNRPVVTTVGGATVREDASAITDAEIGGSNVELVGSERVGHFALELSQGGGGEVTIDTESDSVTIRDDGGTFNVTGLNSCQIHGDEVRIDLVTGDVNASTDGDCGLDLIDYEATYDTITVTERLGGVDGRYSLVAKGTDTVDLSAMPTVSEQHAGAWTVEIEIERDSNDLSYQKTHEFDVYGDGS